MKYRYLYKYLPLNEDSTRTITEGTLKFTAPNCFNDPFDSNPWCDEETTSSYLTSRSYKLRHLSPANRLLAKKAISNKMSHRISKDALLNFIREKDGILCLSRDALHPLMWAHYADHHRGFVIELRFDESDNNPLYPLPVKYDSERPALRFSNNDAKLLEDIFLRKGREWHYEQEERSFSRDSQGIHPYPREKMLTSVIAGIRMSPKNIAYLQKLISETNLSDGLDIGFFTASEIPRSYMLSVPGHPRLDRQSKSLCLTPSHRNPCPPV